MNTNQSARRAVPAAGVAAMLVLAACGGGSSGNDDGDGSDGGNGGGGADGGQGAAVSLAPEASSVLEGEGTARSVAGAQTYFESAPVVVLAPDGGPRAVEAGSAGVNLGAPVLLDSDDEAEAAEIERLGASTVLAVGPVSVPDGIDVDVVAPADADELAALLGGPEIVETDAAGAVQAVAGSAGSLVVAAGDWDESGAGAQGEAPSAGPGEAPSAEGDDVTGESGDAQGEAPSGGSGSAAADEPAGQDAPASSEGPADTGDHDVIDELPDAGAAEPAAGETFALGGGTPDELAAAATASAAGANVVVASGGDPRATRESVEAVHTLADDLGLAPSGESSSQSPSAGADEAGTETGTETGSEGASEAGSDGTAPEGGTAAGAGLVVVGLSPDLGDAEQLTGRTEAAATGTQLPAGGQLVLPEPVGDQTGATYVALYGSPDGAALGLLGEQGPEDTIVRAGEVAAPYEALTDTTVVPTLEIIATVASAEPGDDGDYSNETPVERIRPLVDLAAEAGMYVILDLQPGRTDFVSQAQIYEELLLEPHVGLALDPEWRLTPDQVHLTQIGQVPVEEVDEVVTYLADLTAEHDLPQKFLVLHQFQVRMIPDVDLVDQSRDEVRVLVHADGQGPQGAKQDTWRTLLANAPSITAWGWKNFLDEDTPLLSPEGTMAVEPRPDLITYQ
ncbi:MAG: hypothetical protein ACTHXO_01345 [Actinomycetaceae bacterium]